MVNKARLQRGQAETVAIRALSVLAADSVRLGRFLAATGIGPAGIRDAAREPRFLAGVLEHLSEDESAMMAFAQESGIPPEHIVQARAFLSGRPVERDLP